MSRETMDISDNAWQCPTCARINFYTQARYLCRHCLRSRDAVDTDAVADRQFEAGASGQRALDRQPGGSHYRDFTIQPFEYVYQNGLGYAEGNVVKYVSRHRSKNGSEDLRKAEHYIALLLEIEYGEDSE
jgi:hypothetical protein